MKSLKATELQINDWVNIGDVPEEPPYNKPYPCQLKCGRDLDRADEVTFCPIPLTEEILKANGFNVDGIDKRFGTFVIYDWNEDGRYYSHICGEKRPLNYVHELQHALRLCGLTELADNFKLNDK